MVGPHKPEDMDERAGSSQDRRLLKFADELIVDIRDLDINLIDSINPFEKAYQIIAKSMDKATLATIKDAIDKQMNRIPNFTQNDINIYWPQINMFFKEYGKSPDRLSDDPYEARLGEVLTFIAFEKAKSSND